MHEVWLRCTKVVELRGTCPQKQAGQEATEAESNASAAALSYDVSQSEQASQQSGTLPVWQVVCRVYVRHVSVQRCSNNAASRTSKELEYQTSLTHTHTLEMLLRGHPKRRALPNTHPPPTNTGPHQHWMGKRVSGAQQTHPRPPSLCTTCQCSASRLALCTDCLAGQMMNMMWVGATQHKLVAHTVQQQGKGRINCKRATLQQDKGP